MNSSLTPTLETSRMENIWKEKINRRDRIWAEDTQEKCVVNSLFHVYLEKCSSWVCRDFNIEDKSVDTFSVFAGEKARQKSTFRNQLLFTVKSVHLDIQAHVPRLSLSSCGLPEEIILSVYWLMYADFCSIACKIFRCIALLSSRLWVGCPLNICMPPHIFVIVICRSDSAGSIISFKGYSTISLYPPGVSVTKLLEHNAKWKMSMICSLPSTRYGRCCLYANWTTVHGHLRLRSPIRFPIWRAATFCRSIQTSQS